MKFHVRENRKSSPLYVESPRGRLTEHPGGSPLIESHGSVSLSLSLSLLLDAVNLAERTRSSGITGAHNEDTPSHRMHAYARSYAARLLAREKL